MTALDAKRSQFRFWVKVVLTTSLVVLADRLFLFHNGGWTVGLFTGAWLVLAIFTHPEIRRDGRALTAAAFAALFAGVLVDHPSLLGWELFCTAIAVMVLSPRIGAFDNAVRWTLRLSWMGFAGLLGPLLDLWRLRRIRRKQTVRPLWRRLAMLIPPLLGGAVFTALFAKANPLIAQALSSILWPAFNASDLMRIPIWGFVFCMTWATFRPRRLKTRRLAFPKVDEGIPLPSTNSIVLSLAVFNVLFAIENGLDIAFLWSGAQLPAGLTLAEYAHQGAYPLIATALLAGLFVLVCLRPGSDTATQPLVRNLVILWVAQNIFLVASSALRTVDYIQAYDLTRLRIAALIWTGLVAVGLTLICWRLLRAKSASWLINTNVAAALAVLIAANFVDLGEIAARWNVTHAREVDGTGSELDFCYLSKLGDAAVIPLIELERKPLDPIFRERVAAVRLRTFGWMLSDHSEWREWTGRYARRKSEAIHLMPELTYQRAAIHEDGCQGD